LSAGKFRSLSGLRADSARRATKALLTPSNPFRPHSFGERASDPKKDGRERLRLMNVRLMKEQVEFRYLFVYGTNEDGLEIKAFKMRGYLASFGRNRRVAAFVVGLFLYSGLRLAKILREALWAPLNHDSCRLYLASSFSEIVYFQLLGGFVCVIRLSRPLAPCASLTQ